MAKDQEKYNFIVVKYPQVDTAEAALAVVRKLEKEKVVKLKDAVAITKTEKGKIKLHQTKDDPASKGFLKGGLIGLIFAVLFGPAGWIVAGAALGTAFAMFDRGIKNKLLKELGEEMTSDESALAVLVVEADWDTVRSRMDANNFSGEVVINQQVDEHLDGAEELVENEDVVGTVPDELELPEASEEEAAESEDAEADESEKSEA
jgi:uncharacterized membrane protein